MSVLGKHFAFVSRYIRSLRGRFQPFLAEASDGEVYVVKLAGHEASFNEVAGTELYRALGLPICPWQPLHVSDSFLDQHPLCWPEVPGGRERPTSGVYFGSRFLGYGHRNVFEILPGSYFQRIKRPMDFWLAWLIDVCASHADHRQALFVQREMHELEAVFIDFGHMFGGQRENEPSGFWASRYRDQRIYLCPSALSLQRIKKLACSLNEEQLWRQLATIPTEWKSRPALQNFTTSLNRLADSQFVEKSLSLMVDSVRPCSNDEFLPTNVRSPSESILPARIQANRKIRTAIA